jgi:hypothetical protein
MPALGTYNTVTLGANTATQLTPPGPGNYVLYLLNSVAAGKLYISDKNTVGANATSFMLPTGVYAPAIPVQGSVWVNSDTAGPISVLCVAAR